jgi:hypothetical protein
MKRTIVFIILFAGFACLASGQYKVAPNRPYSTLKSNPGFVTINELTGGFGLAGKSYPFSKYYFGFTTVNGYQVNKNFIAAAGTGLSFYDAGLLIPLFLDFRFAFYVGTLTPYIFGDGGLLLNIANFDESKLFINPGLGARYTLGRSFAVNIGAGILSQVDGINRASFAVVKLGGMYVF